MIGFSWKVLAGLRHARVRPVALPLADGRVLVAQGTVTIYDPTYEVRPVMVPEVYDPKQNAWADASHLVDAEGNLSEIEGLIWNGNDWNRVRRLPVPTPPGTLNLPDGTVVSAGGAEWKDAPPYGRRETAVATIQLTPARAESQPAALMQARIAPVLTLLSNGSVLVTGGYETQMDYSWETVYRSVALTEIFDPKSGDVADGGMLSCPRHEHTTILLPDGSALVIGGRQHEGKELADVELGVPG